MGDENKGYLKWRTTLALCHPLGARSTPVDTRLSLGKSSVLYLCFRFYAEKGLAAVSATWADGQRTGRFCADTDEIRICTEGKIRLPGEGSKGISKPTSRCSDNFIASLHFHWTSHGFCRRYSDPCTVGCKRRH